MNGWIERFRASTLLRNVALLTSGTLLSHALIALSAPFLTRLYSPEDFGLFATYLALAAPLLIAANLCFALTIPLAQDEGAAAALFRLCLLLIGVNVLAATAVAAVAGSALLELLRVPNLVPYLWAFPVVFGVAGVCEALNYRALRRKDYRALAHSRLALAVGLVAAQVGFGWADYGVPGLMVGELLGRGLSALPLLRGLGRGVAVRPALGEIALRYASPALMSCGSGMLSAMSNSMPPLFLTFFYGPATAGWYALAMRVIWGPFQAVRVSVGDVYLAEATHLLRVDPPALPGLYATINRKMFLVEGLPSALLSLTCPLWLGFVFGADWAETGIFALICTPMFLVGCFGQPAALTLLALEKAHWRLAWDCVRLILTLGSVSLLASLGQSARVAVAGYAAGLFVSYLALYALTATVLRRRTEALALEGTTGREHAGAEAHGEPCLSREG